MTHHTRSPASKEQLARRGRWLALCAFVLVSGSLSCGSRQTGVPIYEMSELATEQIRALDPQRTVILIPGGILEQHGPYLPAFTDGYVNEFLTTEIAERMVARNGWAVVRFPMIPLGAGGANQVGLKHVFPGTYHVHFAALRSAFMDIAAELGEAGFRWVFVVSTHGAMAHKRALDQASDFFNDVYGGTMVHLTGIAPPAPRAVDLGLTATELAEIGLEIHGGMDETSRILFLRPELVHPGYRNATPYSGRTWAELTAVGQAADWPGYFGSPRLATRSRGEKLMQAEAADLSDVALQILDGLDPRGLERDLSAASADAGRVRYSQESDRHDAAIEAKKTAWLLQKGYR